MQRYAGLCLMLLSVVTLQTAAVEQGESRLAEIKVARAQFATAISDREPVDHVAVVSPPTDTVFFFTDLRNLQGQTIVHRWEYRGQVMSQVPFDVGGPRWRVFSKKVLEPGTYGEWSVTVLDESGWPLYVELFRYDPVPGQAGAAGFSR